MPWIALGTVVMIQNDEGDHLQPNYAQPTPFNAPSVRCKVQSVHSRVGLWGSPVGPKVIFPEIVLGPRETALLKQVV